MDSETQKFAAFAIGNALFYNDLYYAEVGSRSDQSTAVVKQIYGINCTGGYNYSMRMFNGSGFSLNNIAQSQCTCICKSIKLMRDSSD